LTNDIPDPETYMGDGFVRKKKMIEIKIIEIMTLILGGEGELFGQNKFDQWFF